MCPLPDKQISNDTDYGVGPVKFVKNLAILYTIMLCTLIVFFAYALHMCVV